MDRQNITVSADAFRSVLIPMAAVLSGLATLSGFASILLLLKPGTVDMLIQDLYLGGITAGSALITWQVIHIGITVVCFVWAGIMAGCLWAMVLKRPGQGLLTLSNVAEFTVLSVNLSGIAVLVIFAYKLIRYVVMCLGINEGPYLLYSMLISEALMVAQAVGLYVLVKRLLDSLSDAAAALARAVTGGVLRSSGIPGFAATGLGLLALVELLVASDRLFTLTIVRSYIQDYYKILVAEDPFLRCSGILFLFCAATNLLLMILLRRYKRMSERLSFEKNRLK